MYRALYREYRPKTFSMVFGQEHITDVLKNQVAAGHIAHAYLFCGPRGTGKTSCAKIFARAVNCTSPKNGEPCGECESCKSILNESSIDVIEMDAASNNGVENIRDIRDRVQLAPSGSRYKVYIIDEVHMLSKGACNALLKTLEEPPAHAIFILATTEPRKLPATILSRCQRFDFRRIPNDKIVADLKFICESEGITGDEDALFAIASYADGAMRDAISILDRLRAVSDKIDIKTVSEALGGSAAAKLMSVAVPMCAYDEKNAIKNLISLISDGGDYGMLMRDLTAVLSDTYSVAYLGIQSGLSRYYDDIKLLEAAGKEMGKSGLMRAVEVLLAREYDVRMSSQPDIALISAVLRAMSPEADISALSERADKIESKLQQLENRAVEYKSPDGSNVDKKAVLGAPKQESKDKPEKKKQYKSTPEAADVWAKVVSALSTENQSHYIPAKKVKPVSISGDKIYVENPDDLSIVGELLKDGNFGDIMKKICIGEFGHELSVEVIKPDDAEEVFPWNDVEVVDRLEDTDK